MTLSPGKGTPMIPVEEGKTSSKMQWKVSAVATQVWMQASIPAWPVAQLALPAFTSRAPTRPPVARRWRWPTVTGAATTWFLVNIAAAFAGLSGIAIATSSFPLALIPAFTAPHLNPCGRAWLPAFDSLDSLLILFTLSSKMLWGG
jgi:hypothetical protein